jgi:hypothetical protein
MRDSSLNNANKWAHRPEVLRVHFVFPTGKKRHAVCRHACAENRHCNRKR